MEFCRLILDVFVLHLCETLYHKYVVRDTLLLCLLLQGMTCVDFGVTS